MPDRGAALTADDPTIWLVSVSTLDRTRDVFQEGRYGSGLPARGHFEGGKDLVRRPDRRTVRTREMLRGRRSSKPPRFGPTGRSDQLLLEPRLARSLHQEQSRSQERCCPANLPTRSGTADGGALGGQSRRDRRGRSEERRVGKECRSRWS